MLSILLTEKKCLAAPIKDFAFLMQAFVSAFLLSSAFNIKPRYLKMFVNWMCWLSGRGT
jgi:hypothetical protein